MNAFKQSLVGTYTTTDTVIELNSISDTPGNPDYLVTGVPLILYDSLFGNPADSNNAGDYEIVLVTDVNYATNEITVTRAQENTTAQTISAGWSAVYGLTQAMLDGKEPIKDRRFSFVVSRLEDINEQINTGRRLRVRISSTGTSIGDVMTCNVRMGIRSSSSNRRVVERTAMSEGDSTTMKDYTVGSVDLASDTLVFSPVTATSFDVIYNVNSTDMISFSMRIDITCSEKNDVFTITEIVNEVQP